MVHLHAAKKQYEKNLFSLRNKIREVQLA